MYNSLVTWYASFDRVIYWRRVKDVLKQGGEYWQRFSNWLCKVLPNLVPLEPTKPSEESCSSFSQISPYSHSQLNCISNKYLTFDVWPYLAFSFGRMYTQYSLYLGLFKKYSLYLGFFQRPSIDTFLVVSRRGNSSADHVFRFNKAKSLCLFGPLNPIRRFAIRLVTNKYPFKQRSTYSKNVNANVPCEQWFLQAGRHFS